MEKTETRFTFVDFAYRGFPEWGIETDALISIGDPDYDRKSEEDSFDGMLWFNFRDEAEFKSAFEDNEEFDFIIIKEHNEQEK